MASKKIDNSAQKIESPFQKAWKRLKKNYPAVVSMWIIAIAIFIALFAAIISPDKTPNANDQILELANEVPGFSVDILKIKKNRPARKTSVLGKYFVGKDNTFTMVPINSYSFEGSNIIVDVYRGSKYASEKDTFNIVNVILSKETKNVQVDGDALTYTINDVPEKALSLTEVKSTIENKHIFKKTYRLGTDKFGRDVLSRLFFGLRVSLSVGLIAVLISLIIGISIGASSGYFRNDKIKMSNASKMSGIVIFLTTSLLAIFGVNIGIVDDGLLSFLIGTTLIISAFLFLRFVLKAMSKFFKNRGFFNFDDFMMWIINVVWSIPTILLAMSLSFTLGKWLESFWVIYIAVGLSMWVDVARIVRGQVMSEREMEYVQAARALGFGNFRIIFLHILPNIFGPLMVIMAANFAAAILIEAGLSFIGIGVQPPMPSLGNMLSEYYGYLQVPGKAFLALSPGFAIMILVLSFNLVGNGLRDAFDVKGK